jgi:RimJ/RimL family protein N-acetyltransferase
VRYIGDKGVRNRDDACQYILTGPVASYERFGFGLYRVALEESGQPIGICGVLKRDTLEHPDVGFAFLQRFWAKGYAFESAAAVMVHARETLGLERILAITSQDNTASIGLLDKLGFTFERMLEISDDEPEIKVFVSAPRPQRAAARSGRR